MIPEQFALLLIKQKNHDKRFGEFEFKYFGGSDVANKLEVQLNFLPWCSGVCRTNFGILLELFGGESWSKSIKRSDSVGLVRVEIAIASLLLEDEDDMVWKKWQKIKGGLSLQGIFNLVFSLKV